MNVELLQRQGRSAFLQVPPSADIVVGIDTYKYIRAAVALSALGVRLGATTVPASRAGYRRIEAWARSLGTVMAFGVEGTGSYGAGLARALREAGYPVPRGQSAGPRRVQAQRQGRHARCRDRGACRPRGPGGR